MRIRRAVATWGHDIGLENKVRRDRKLALLAAAIAEYEHVFGEITVEEIAVQRRADRQDATVVRGRSRAARNRRGRDRDRRP